MNRPTIEANLYVFLSEEQEARDELIGSVDEENWEPDTKAFELWSSAENVEEMQGTSNKM